MSRRATERSDNSLSLPVTAAWRVGCAHASIAPVLCRVASLLEFVQRCPPELALRVSLAAGSVKW